MAGYKEIAGKDGVKSSGICKAAVKPEKLHVKMVAGRGNSEAITLEKNPPEQLENVLEDDEDDLPEDDVSGNEGSEEEGGDFEGEDDEDDDDEEEEDPEDPQDILREKCEEKSKCMALKSEFDICQARVSSKMKTDESCAQELLDFVGCVDHCVSKSLFSHLK